MEVGTIDEDFTGGANNDPAAVTGWTNVAATGTRNWQFKDFRVRQYLLPGHRLQRCRRRNQVLAGHPAPSLTMSRPSPSSPPKPSGTHDGLTVWISTDFVCDPLAATWTPVSCTLAGESDADHTWIPSGNIDLSAYVGQKVAIGFKYEGNNTAGLTTSYRIDNVLVE